MSVDHGGDSPFLVASQVDLGDAVRRVEGVYSVCASGNSQVELFVGAWARIANEVPRCSGGLRRDTNAVVPNVFFIEVRRDPPVPK